MWTCSVRSHTDACSYRVLPDNCIDILWQDSSALGFATGMMTASKSVTMTAQVSTIAVRFKPGRASHFFQLPLNELTDLHADMRELWGRDRAGRINDALWTKPLSDRERMHILEKHLIAHLTQGRITPPFGLVNHAVAAIESSCGAVKIDALAKNVGVTRQHLAARFRVEVGISAKTFARICRFRRAMAGIRHARASAERIDWAALALDSGYFDQSHLIHDFQEFAADSPESFAIQRASSV